MMLQTGVVKNVVANDEEWMDRSRGGLWHTAYALFLTIEKVITKTVLTTDHPNTSLKRYYPASHQQLLVNQD